jgi:hypothetical protein
MFGHRNLYSDMACLDDRDACRRNDWRLLGLPMTSPRYLGYETFTAEIGRPLELYLTKGATIQSSEAN